MNLPEERQQDFSSLDAECLLGMGLCEQWCEEGAGMCNWVGREVSRTASLLV